MMRWKKASFTVEAAFLVPAATVVLVLLLGYIYFVHERSWAAAAAGEAGFYALQRTEGEETPQELLDMRLQERTGDDPLGVQAAEFTVDVEKMAFQISAVQQILPEAFGEIFSMEIEVEVKRFEPVKLKRLSWLGAYALSR